MIEQPVLARGGHIQHVLGMRHANRLHPDQGPALVIEVTVPPGLGAPPHMHDVDEEFFYVLDGELTVDLDGRRHVLHRGDSCLLPAGMPHAFKNSGAGDARILAWVSPGYDAYAFFCSVDKESSGPEEVVRAAERHGLTFA